MTLICREDLLDEIEKSSNSTPGGGFAAAGAKIAFMRAITAIKDAPTLTLDDLRPKGRWIHKRSIYDSNIYICSNCKEQISILGNKLPSCPYCIANMRGGGEDG